MKSSYKILRLILGDQLNQEHSWFDQQDPNTLYVIMEMRQETDYVQHHIQKVIAFFRAMRAFAESLSKQGHQVLYLKMDDVENQQSLTQNLDSLIKKYKIQQFQYQLPDEYRLDQQLKDFSSKLKIDTSVSDTEHFLTQRQELSDFFEGKKTYLMESFYRQMRKRLDVLMDGDKPKTGKWNYDHDNRKKLPRNHIPLPPINFTRDVSDIIQLLKDQEVQTIGNIDETNFNWPLTYTEAQQTLSYFIEELLPYFGQFQDAMSTMSWSIYHSRLSFCLNAKIISPFEIIKAVEGKWLSDPEHASIAQVEGFIRQIMGWREYMRGIYWAKMPDYATKNFFNHERKLPNWFWTGQTKMNCLKHAIGQSLDHAYAHHIQRLMVTGNFALLAGIDPDQVDEWYLGIYIDAIEWVEITNTRGMSQFADGGIVGTKPYVSSANYIDKMSDYCSGCFYQKKTKTGENACPFNSLYWHFYARNRTLLQNNPRIGMMYRVWDKMNTQNQNALLNQAEAYLEKIDTL